MKKSNSKFVPVPNCVNWGDFVVYYVTCVLGLPIFINTELFIFNTPKYIKWLQENNLPYWFKDLMLSHNKLSDEFKSHFSKEVALVLPPNKKKLIEDWIEKCRKAPRWNYKNIQHEFMKFFPS